MRNTILIVLLVIIYSCDQEIENMSRENKAIFLHHSTGNNIWKGNPSKISYKLFKEGDVEKWIKKNNKENSTNYFIKEQAFPKKQPYGWNNYPYDYYNIWVKNAGEKPYMEEPTLEMLTKEYSLIIWKHCYPVGKILEDVGTPDIDSDEKRLENYKLQYNALKEKMHQFSDTKFIVWTGAALVEANTTEDNAKRMREFVSWVKNEWNEENDNIYIWDFYELETEGGLYIKPEYAKGLKDSHPNEEFSGKIAPLFAKFVVEVLAK